MKRCCTTTPNLHAWQVTQDEFYRRIAEQTLNYVVREMTHPLGGFFSSQDADSEGHEGKFFVWTLHEFRAALGGSASGLLIVSKTRSDTDDAQLSIGAYGVTERGSFEGKNILFVARDPDVLAAMHKLSEAEVESQLTRARQKLFEGREQRVKPARDEKVLTGCNGLMLAAFAEAARVLQSRSPIFGNTLDAEPRPLFMCSQFRALADGVRIAGSRSGVQAVSPLAYTPSRCG